MTDEVKGYYPDSHYVTITLDSPGGSLAEAIRLMDTFRDLQIATRIDAKATCLSACAVAFLGGSRLVANEFWTSRTVEPGGQLGFHAPSLSLPAGDLVPTQALTASYGLALESISSILDRRDRFDIPVSLVETMIATPPDQMYVLDKVDDFARWKIAVAMDQSKWRPDKADVARMCLNLGVWESGDSVARIDASFKSEANDYSRHQQVAEWAAKVKFLPPSRTTGIQTVYAYATETGMEVSTCVARFTIFKDQWYPRIFLSDSSPEIALQAAQQSNTSSPAPYMLHALPHDFSITALR
ncbi:hypothetical protein [Antarctobacter sp.]|uniref:hypothetical protein n=1 Tax=Antarctobacter sp. TaxID=1872577 RepID=UPI003A912150